MSIVKVDGTGLGASSAPGGAGQGSNALFNSLLSDSLEDAKKKQEQGLVSDGLSGISIFQLDTPVTHDEEDGLSVGKSDSATDIAQKLLKEMTDGGLQGYFKWAMDQLKEKVRGQVMQSMGITDKDLAAMPQEQRIATEKAIEDAVTKKIKEMLAEQMKNNDPAEQEKIKQLMAALA